MKKIDNSKGITLIALVITIIVLLIVASIATYSGIQVVESSKFTAFVTEMKIMQAEVNNLYDQWKNGKITIDETTGNITNTADNSVIGKDLTYNSDVQRQANEVLIKVLGLGSSINDLKEYKYFDHETIQNLGIDAIDGEFFINIKTRKVVSYEGIEYDGEWYYTLEQLPDGLYNVDYTPGEYESPTFDVDYEIIGENKYRIKISNIEYKGYINKWTVKYQLEGKDYENTSEDLSFVVNEEGKYNIKIENGEVTSNVVTKNIGYVKDGLIVYYDGINNTGNGHDSNATIWKDLSGSNNDITLYNFNNNKESGWVSDGIILDGIDDYMYRENPLYNKSSTNITVEVISEKTKSQYGSVLNFGTITNKRHFLEIWTSEIDDGTNRCYTICHYPGMIYNIPTSELNLNQLNSISYGTNNKETYIYKDGKQINKKTIPEGTDTSWGSHNGLYLGREYLYAETDGEIVNGVHCYFAGKIKSVRIYNRLLTKEEIQNNYKMDNYRYKIEE